MNQKARGKLQALLLELLLILVSLVVLVPIYMMVVGSFKNASEASSFSLALPTVWEPQNYAQVLQSGGILSAFVNGILYSFVSTAVVCLASAMAAFVIVRARRRALNGMYYIFIIGLVLPPNMIASVFLLKALGLYGSRLGLIAVYIAWAVPLMVFLYTGFVKNISQEIDESAILDGCSLSGLFFRIILPLLKPIHFTTAIVSILGVWNDFTAQLYFTNSSSLYSMPLSIYKFFGMYSRQWNLVFADMVLTTIPIAIIYLFFQRYIIDGMTAGSVKG